VQALADTGATRNISWLHQTVQADGFQHFKTAISTQSYGNSGLEAPGPDWGQPYLDVCHAGM